MEASEEAAHAVASADSLPVAAPVEPVDGRAAEEAAQAVASADSLPVAAPVEPADGQAAEEAAQAVASADSLPVAAPVEPADGRAAEEAARAVAGADLATYFPKVVVAFTFLFFESEFKNCTSFKPWGTFFVLWSLVFGPRSS